MDFGAQVNAQMAAMTGGGVIQLPPGITTFSTRIQCPIAQNRTYRFIGAAQQSYTTGLGSQVDNSGGTQLVWVGNGVAIDQTITDPNYNWQSLKGCEFSDFSLINKGNQYSSGIAFGGTQHTLIERVTISGFYNGVLVTNPAGGTTERYKIHALLEDNTFGIQFYAYTGGSNSFGYGEIDIDLLLRANPISRCAIYVDGQIPAGLYNSIITIRGNIFASPGAWNTWQYLFLVGGNGSINNNIIRLLLECDEAGTCGMFQNWGKVTSNNTVKMLQSYPGAWNSVGGPVS